MADERKFADAESLRPVVRAAFGRDRSPLRVERLSGGSKKGAYRLAMDDGSTAFIYAWDDSEDYWQGVLPEDADDPADPFSHASGLALFEAAARRLASAGVRCPELLFTDRSRVLYPAEIAVVEDVAGGSLEALLERDPVAAERPLSVLGDWLAAMAAVRSPSYGKVAFVDAGGRTAGTSCERVMLDRARSAIWARTRSVVSRSRGSMPSVRAISVERSTSCRTPKRSRPASVMLTSDARRSPGTGSGRQAPPFPGGQFARRPTGRSCRGTWRGPSGQAVHAR
jgi:hypothetical protein